MSKPQRGKRLGAAGIITVWEPGLIPTEGEIGVLIAEIGRLTKALERIRGGHPDYYCSCCHDWFEAIAAEALWHTETKEEHDE